MWLLKLLVDIALLALIGHTLVLYTRHTINSEAEETRIRRMTISAKLEEVEVTYMLRPTSEKEKTLLCIPG